MYKSLESNDKDLQRKAILVSIKTAPAVVTPYLLKLLLSSVVDDKALAGKALSQMSLRGKPTEIIVQTYAKSDGAAKITLLEFLGNRAVKGSVSFFLKASEEGDTKLRKAALKALKNTSLAGDTANLLAALRKITKKTL